MYNKQPKEFIVDFGDASWKRIITPVHIKKSIYAFGCGVYTIEFSVGNLAWCITYRDGKDRFKLGKKEGYKDFRDAVDVVKEHNKENPTLNLHSSSRGNHTSK